MRKILFVLAVAMAGIAFGQEQRLGLFLMGNRIGTSTYRTSKDVLFERQLNRSDSTTVMNVGLMGKAVEMKMDSSSWTDPATGKPVRMTFVQESSGRSQKLVAVFGSKIVRVDIDNSGEKSSKVLTLPTGYSVVDDPLTDMLASGVTKRKQAFYVLDPTTVSFVKNVVEVKGSTKVDVNGVSRQATLVTIDDPRAGMSVYVDGKGGVVKIDGPMGIEMIPESSATPVPTAAPSTTPIDLANVTSIPVTPEIDDATTTTFVSLRFKSKSLAALPNDDHQTVKRDGDDWLVTIHPPQIAKTRGLTLAEARASKPNWTQPSLNIPCNEARFKTLAAQITKGSPRVRDAAMAIRRYVHSIMTPNAGIGVLRDANEVLSTKEGVCRDYAILTATLARAAGIPTKVSSGLIYYNGRLYYHAWANAWDGKRWIGLDSTVEDDQMSAVHVELATGSVEDAFTFTFLDKADVKVLKVERS